MSNHLKKHGFPLTFTRLFTRGDEDAYQLIHFLDTEQMGDETFPALEAPDHWSPLATELLAEQAACKAIPTQTKAVEENTVPSWLWRHTATGKGTQSEESVQQIFTRVVGAATYAGWKQGLFGDEIQARNFFDETRYALAQRFMAIQPNALAPLGLDWAYGIKKIAAHPLAMKTDRPTEIPNTAVDAIVSGRRDANVQTKWQKLLGAKKSAQPVAFRFSDIAADWGTNAAQETTVILDVMAFRHNDGTVNIDALRHAVRLSVVLMDLQDHPAAKLSIGFSNLGALLAALALAYDSDGGRTMAAAISAIITSSAYAASAELAALRGPSVDYINHRETTLRSLRNRRRAAYGDNNDYEKISVLPVPLGLEKCPDLALVAAAQRSWDETLEMVRSHGLRHTQVTGLLSSPALALFMESATQGIEPIRSLTTLAATASDIYQRRIAPYIVEAFSHLGYDSSSSHAIVQHILGRGTLDKAPLINHASLRARGFDNQALERVEVYLQNVNDIRLSFTPWIVGEDFCRKVLKISAAKLQSTSFDLLRHLGFSEDNVVAANTYCYGHGTVAGSKELRPKHATIFALKSEVSVEAKIRMAAAVQSFVSGDVQLNLSLTPTTPIERSEKLLLSAWRQGVKSLILAYDAEDQEEISAPKQKTSLATFIHTRKQVLPTRKSKPQAGRRLVSQQTGASKSIPKGRGK